MDTVHLDTGYKYARVFVFVQHNANDPTPSNSLNYWSKVSRVYLFSQRVGCPPVAPDYENARLIPHMFIILQLTSRFELLYLLVSSNMTSSFECFELFKLLV